MDPHLPMPPTDHHEAPAPIGATAASLLPPLLICGDPDTHRACFSRFILPIQWKIDKQARSETAVTGWYFGEAGKKDWMHSAHEADSKGDRLPMDVSRSRYYSRETNDLLYKRARWFVLRKNGAEREALWTKRVCSTLHHRENVSYEVSFRPPALVLFEAKAGKQDDLQIGFLVHEAYFPNPDKAPDYFDLLAFNEIFRYWRCPFDDHRKYCEALLRPLQDFWCGELGCTEINYEGDAPYSSHWTSLLDCPVQTEGGYFNLQSGFKKTQEGPSPYPRWCVNPDDRAYTIAFVPMEERRWMETLSKEECDAIKKDTAETIRRATPGNADHAAWLRLLNVDQLSEPSLGSVSGFEAGWLKDRTYLRWAESGTLYGFCEHASATLCTGSYEMEKEEDNKSESSVRSHGDPPLGEHGRNHYTDSTLILLYLRCAVFALSAKLHEITARARDEGVGIANREWRQKFLETRTLFLHLENLYQFPVFSNQQQHLEMFTLQRRYLDVKELHEELDKEIKSSDELFENLVNEERTTHSEMLNRVGFFGLIIALALGWMDARSAHGEDDGIWFIGMILYFGTILGLYNYLLNKKFNRRKLGE